jgi:hypothetical protein
MSEFKCPKCRAQVKKEATDKPGCPACGFGHSGHSHDHDHQKCSQCHESISKCRGHMICG